MRLIGTLATEHQARTLTDWLTAEGIDSKFERENLGFEVWVKSEDLLDRAKQEFVAFQANPLDQKYLSANQRAAEVRRAREDRQKQFERNVKSAREVVGVYRSTLTMTFIILCGLVALLTNFGRMNPIESSAFKALTILHIPPPAAMKMVEQANGDSENLSLKFANILRGEVWRLVTPIFLHFGALHLIFNMLWLFQFGRMIETRYGAGVLTILVILIAVFSNFGQVLVPDRLGGTHAGLLNGHLLIQLGGMSGVVYGLFGFIWVKATIDPTSRFQVAMSTIIILLAWLFFCMLPAAQVGMGMDDETGTVANWAHAIGLVAGMAMAYLATAIRKQS